MSRDFQVGDRVTPVKGYKWNSTDRTDQPHNPESSQTGVVTNVPEDSTIQYEPDACGIDVEWDNGNSNGYDHEDLRLIENPTDWKAIAEAYGAEFEEDRVKFSEYPGMSLHMGAGRTVNECRARAAVWLMLAQEMEDEENA